MCMRGYVWLFPVVHDIVRAPNPPGVAADEPTRRRGRRLNSPVRSSISLCITTLIIPSQADPSVLLVTFRLDVFSIELLFKTNQE